MVKAAVSCTVAGKATSGTTVAVTFAPTVAVLLLLIAMLVVIVTNAVAARFGSELSKE